MSDEADREVLVPVAALWLLCFLVGFVGLAVLLSGCSAPGEFWTRSSTVPIEYRVPLLIEGDPRVLRERDVVAGDLEEVVSGSLRLFNEADGRAVPRGAVSIANEDDVIIEPGDREERFIFRLSRPKLRMCGDDWCVVVRVAETTACPRGDVPYPAWFKRCLLTYLGQLAVEQARSK